MDLKQQTYDLIDDLKAVCHEYGLGNDGNEYKVITQMFLYKFLNDKFGYEIKRLNPKIAKAEKWETAYADLSDKEREDLLDSLSADIMRLYPEHLISHLWNQQAKGDFDLIFDRTMVDIADKNIDIFSTQTTKNTKIPIFEKLTNYVTDDAQKAPFARALVDKLAKFSFEEAFSESYDFFSAIFEYVIKDYNTNGGGVYAEYYTPHAIAVIMAKLLVGNSKNLHNIECYDPAAGTGTLLMALAHQVGEDKCTIFAQDRSQKSNKMLKLNLILNGLVSSLDHAVQGDTLTDPYHMSDDKKTLRTFDYIVCNPPFNLNFEEIREKLAAMPSRFWSGVPKIPTKEKESMAIYTCFIQHVINSLKEKGKAAIVVPSGFLTDTGSIQSKIREKILKEKQLYAVIQMPTNVFSNTNTSVSIIFLDKGTKHDEIMMIDASRVGQAVKIGDVTKTVFSKRDETEIVEAVTKRKNIPEFSSLVTLSNIQNNDSLIKPGLYFEMNYESLNGYELSMEAETEKMKQRKEGLIRILRSSYARNLIISWFVKFNFPNKSGQIYKTEYGNFPKELELCTLESLVETPIGGEWGKEDPSGTYIHEVRCIRGTDIPNIAKSYYDDIPLRYVKQKHINEKRVVANDIIVEISGGSPIQSTGRICLITNNILEDLNHPVLCTNFCRILRLKKPEYAEYIYNYLALLYSRGYFFNLENNTTGIKNLIFNSFLKKIKIPFPKDIVVMERFFAELDQYCKQIKL